MENILYLDDYINLYNKKTCKLFITKPYKNTLKNGFIKDRHKFIKKFQEILKTNEITSSFFNENLIIIINNLYTSEDKLSIKEIMEELNYKNIKFIQEINYLNLSKNNIYINFNYSYFYILYTNLIGNIEINLYKNDEINKKLIIYILKHLNKKEIIVYGKNILELINILNKEKKEYYYYEESGNLIINKLLDDKKV